MDDDGKNQNDIKDPGGKISEKNEKETNQNAVLPDIAQSPDVFTPEYVQGNDKVINNENLKSNSFSTKNEAHFDLKDKPKYDDTQSYISQRHHSIGHGLYCTDDYKDLPPRHKTKIINVLKTTAENFNIPFDYMLSQLENSTDKGKHMEQVFNSNSRNENKSSPHIKALEHGNFLSKRSDSFISNGSQVSSVSESQNSVTRSWNSVPEVKDSVNKVFSQKSNFVSRKQPMSHGKSSWKNGNNSFSQRISGSVHDVNLKRPRNSFEDAYPLKQRVNRNPNSNHEADVNEVQKSNKCLKGINEFKNYYVAENIPEASVVVSSRSCKNNNSNREMTEFYSKIYSEFESSYPSWDNGSDTNVPAGTNRNFSCNFDKPNVHTVDNSCNKNLIKNHKQSSARKNDKKSIKYDTESESRSKDMNKSESIVNVNNKYDKSKQIFSEKCASHSVPDNSKKISEVHCASRNLEKKNLKDNSSLLSTKNIDSFDKSKNIKSNLKDKIKIPGNFEKDECIDKNSISYTSREEIQHENPHKNMKGNLTSKYSVPQRSCKETNQFKDSHVNNFSFKKYNKDHKLKNNCVNIKNSPKRESTSVTTKCSGEETFTDNSVKSKHSSIKEFCGEKFSVIPKDLEKGSENEHLTKSISKKDEKLCDSLDNPNTFKESFYKSRSKKEVTANLHRNVSKTNTKTFCLMNDNNNLTQSNSSKSDLSIYDKHVEENANELQSSKKSEDKVFLNDHFNVSDASFSTNKGNRLNSHSKNYSPCHKTGKGDSSRFHNVPERTYFQESTAVVKNSVADLKMISGDESICKRKYLIENGFFIKINISDTPGDLEYWQRLFREFFKHSSFDLDLCCRFSYTLILNFNTKSQAIEAKQILNKVKKNTSKSKIAHIISISDLKSQLKKPCDCESLITEECISFIENFHERYVKEHRKKIKEVESDLKAVQQSINAEELSLTLKDKLNILKECEAVFNCYVKETKLKLKRSGNFSDIRKLRTAFIRECNIFQRSLPIYSKRNAICNLFRFHSISVVIAETGSGKSTQLVEYALEYGIAEEGTIICTQPRKIAAISITHFVSGQIGSAVGKIVGYDLGIEKKFCDSTKIIYTTDYCLLRKCIKDRNLTGISCIIIDEAHERSLYTDLLLGMLKQCIQMRPDLRIIITSATINPSVFKSFFHLKSEAVIDVPGRSYPVDIRWLEDDVSENYISACVEKAYEIHMKKEKGDILVFLTCASEIEEAINMFKDKGTNEDKMPCLISFHGKSDIQEQMLAFQNMPNCSRKIIFATNAAETSLTFPGIKFVIDSGMAKEMVFDPKRNKSVLTVTFINKSSAEQRKGRAGRTQPGVCYRMYTKAAYEKMHGRALPEILKINLQKALLKIFEFGLKPEHFEFVESPPKELIEKSLESLEFLGAIQNNKLTNLGKKIVQLPVEPRLAKLVLNGVNAGIGYEATIIAALLSESGKLFLRTKENMFDADKKKRNFCLEQGDLCTYLDIYKKWLDEPPPERYKWCLRNYINARALKAAAKTVQEIFICLRLELSIDVQKRYNNSAFKLHYESVLFDCFSENLCIFSGHPKLGYLSPHLTEPFFIHPSSSLRYLEKETYDFVIFSTLMETTRNFILDVTPIKEETIKQAFQKGIFKLPIDMLKCLQIHPKVFGPFGESLLIRYVLGKGGSRIVNLESMIQEHIKSRNFQIDVVVDKGLITVHTEKRFHDKILHFINEVIKKGHDELEKEEDVIKMADGSAYFCLGSGGIISDFILPGEYREINIRDVRKCDLEVVISSLKKFGNLQTIKTTMQKGRYCISVTYKKVVDAQLAVSDFCNSSYNVQPNIFHKKLNEKSLPFYKLHVSWCRSSCSGTGWIEFLTEEDCILASGLLTCTSFFLDKNFIYFSPTYHSTKELYMKNLPSFAEERVIEKKLAEILPDHIQIKNIKLLRTNSNKITEKERMCVEKQVKQLFSSFTPSNKLIIDIKYPNPNDIFWSVFVYFEFYEHGELAYKELNGKAKIDFCPVTIEEVLESDLKCSKSIYFAVKNEIKKIEEECKNSKICKALNTNFKENNVCIKFTCTSIEGLSSMRQKLIRLLQGKIINCFGNSKYFFLFNKNSEKFIKKIEQRTKTFIQYNRSRKIIYIYGSEDSCRNAQLEIHSLVSKEGFSSTKVFDLKMSCIPSGFLRCLYSKYGFDLSDFIGDFQLKSASVDIERKTLTLEGDAGKLKKAEECLEKICSELYNSRDPVQKALDSEEICSICLEPISYDFQRLESCGHAFCKQCLLLQLESSSIPFICIKQNCEKKIFLEDIKRILLFGGSHLKKSFCKNAIQYHIKTNLDEIRYCPTPNCQMVYRVRKNDTEFVCPDCGNTICTYCQTPYHFGMTCDMFKKCQEDEDYSLQAWIKENQSKRKNCPSCHVTIEKISGCNHVECLVCLKHLCWLCLEVFPSGNEVYEHLPFCPNNN